MHDTVPLPAGSQTWRPWAVAGTLALAVVIVYAQTLGFHFRDYDDRLFVTDSLPVRAGLTGKSIAWAFTKGPAGEWYPLAMISHMLDCQLYGLWPAGHYLSNLVLHAAAAVGLFFVLRNMTGELWPSAMVAGLFAVHPQNVESVAWIAERRDVLSGLFFMLTLAAYLGYVRHGRSIGRYLLVVAMLTCGLMSKATLTTVPPLLLLLDFWPLGRFGRAADLPPGTAPQRQRFVPLVLEKLPLLAIALADAAMTLATRVPMDPPPWSARIENTLVSLPTYLIHTALPIDLALSYPYRFGGLPGWQLAGSALLLSAVTAGAIAARRICPYFFVGWFWFLGMLFPLSGLVQASKHAMADRYMYLPAIGLYIALAWGAWRLVTGSSSRQRVLAAVAAVAFSVLTARAAQQASYWHDDETLWRHALAVTGDNNYQGEAGLGSALAAAAQYDEAEKHLRRALEMVNDPIARGILGTVYFRQGKFDEAEKQLRLSLEMADDPAVYEILAAVYFQQGKFDEAEAQLRRGLEIYSDSAKLIGSLGAVLAEKGHRQQAADLYLRAIDLDPTLLDPRLNLVRLLAKQGQIDEAIQYCRDAVEFAPDNPLPRQMLATLYEVRARKRAE